MLLYALYAYIKKRNKENVRAIETNNIMSRAYRNKL